MSVCVAWVAEASFLLFLYFILCVDGEVNSQVMKCSCIVPGSPSFSFHFNMGSSTSKILLQSRPGSPRRRSRTHHHTEYGIYAKVLESVESYTDLKV